MYMYIFDLHVRVQVPLFFQAVEVVPVQVGEGKATLGMVEEQEREGREREREGGQQGASRICEL